MATRITKEQITKRRKDLTHNIYKHGGSRIFLDGEAGNRQLLVDTYYDQEFAEYLDKCVRDYFDIKQD